MKKASQKKQIRWSEEYPKGKFWTGRRIAGFIFLLLFIILLCFGLWLIIAGLKTDDARVVFGPLAGWRVIRWSVPLIVPGLVLVLIRDRVYDPIHPIAADFLEDLPNSPTDIKKKKDIRKIYHLLPVPNDYQVLWAEMQSYGRHPAGIVITNRALILKSPKSVIEEQNKAAEKEEREKQEAEQEKQEKKKQKKAKKSKNTIPYVYKIIPWEYFDPNDFQIIKVDGESDTSQTLISLGESDLYQINCGEFIDKLSSMKSEKDELEQKLDDITVASVSAAIATINASSTYFAARYGSGTTPTGHGNYAEKANTYIDLTEFNRATHAGEDNAKDGADRYVNDVAIQCKYCKTAQASVDAYFNKDGSIRYTQNLSDEPMKLEVPKDQYREAVEIMREKILAGEVNGITDPSKAEEIVCEGKVTYRQAVNLAKAGTIESLTYDFLEGAVVCTFAFGISFLITFVQAFWTTKDFKKSIKCALYTGMKVYGLAIFGHVVASQLARTGLKNVFTPIVAGMLKLMPEETVRGMANTVRALSGKKLLEKGVASNTYINTLASQISAQCFMFIIFSLPDIYKVITHNMSRRQFVMNMAEKTAGFVSGAVIGGAVGKVVGSAVNPFVGGIAGLGAGAIGATIVSMGVRYVTHLFWEDDATIVGRLFTAVVQNMAIDYMLSASEQKKLVDMLSQNEPKLKKLQKKLIKSKYQIREINKVISPMMQEIVSQRSIFSLPAAKRVEEEADSIVLKGELDYAV